MKLHIMHAGLECSITECHGDFWVYVVVIIFTSAGMSKGTFLIEACSVEAFSYCLMSVLALMCSRPMASGCIGSQVLCSCMQAGVQVPAVAGG